MAVMPFLIANAPVRRGVVGARRRRADSCEVWRRGRLRWVFHGFGLGFFAIERIVRMVVCAVRSEGSREGSGKALIGNEDLGGMAPGVCEREPGGEETLFIELFTKMSK